MKDKFHEFLKSEGFDYSFPLEQLTENDFDTLFKNIGGRRIEEGSERTADYLIGDAVLELKFLEAEGHHSPVRQKKLADLFRPLQRTRPVVVLDAGTLNDQDKITFQQIYKGTIQSHIRSARKQLKQSRKDNPTTNCSILFIQNISFTALNHDELFSLVRQRVKNDASSIDGVIVAGAYSVSDGFDAQADFQLEYEPYGPIGRAFQDTVEEIRSEWLAHQINGVTSVICGAEQPTNAVPPKSDVSFDYNGVRYVRPAPVLARDSSFFIKGRSRIEALPSESESGNRAPRVVPKLTNDQWNQLVKSGIILEDEDSYLEWTAIQKDRLSTAKPLAQVVAMPVDLVDFKQWCAEKNLLASYDSIQMFAVEIFNSIVTKILENTLELSPNGVKPQRYILVCTELIGQDESNDISHIAEVLDRGEETPVTYSIISDVRMSRSEAMCVAAVNAVAREIHTVFWYENKDYAWV